MGYFGGRMTEVSKEAVGNAALIAKQQELQAQLKKIQDVLGTSKKARETKDALKLNKNGGLYFKDSALRAVSQKDGKEYCPSFNLNFEQARALFNNQEVIEKVRAFVNDDDNRKQSMLMYQQKIINESSDTEVEEDSEEAAS